MCNGESLSGFNQENDRILYPLLENHSDIRMKNEMVTDKREEIEKSGKRRLCDSTFCCHNKVPEINNLKEEMFIWAHGFRDFSPWLHDPIAFEPGKRQYSMAKSTCRTNCSFHSGRKQRKREEQDPDTSFKGMAPVT